MASAPTTTRQARDWIPGRRGLDRRTWELRHNFMVWLLWAHVPFLFAVGVIQGEDLDHVVIEMLPMIIPAIIGMRAKSRAVASMAIAIGLLSASGILVHFTGGLIESHFHFFVMVTVVALYQDWKPLLLAVGYVAAQHAIVGVVAPEEVYNHPAALANPVKWALIHATYILFLVMVQLSHWRLAEKAEAERGASEERFRRSFQEAPIGMAILDNSGKFVQANNAMAEILGYEQNHLAGSSIRSLVHADDHAVLDEAWETMVEDKSHVAKAEMRCLSVDGRSIWARISLSQLESGDVNEPITVLQLEDATQAHQDHKRLQRLVKGKDDFVASVGKEINEPLNELLELAVYAQNGGKPDGNVVAVLAQIEDHAREISGVVEDLIVSAQSDRNPVSVIPALSSVEQICRDALSEVPGGQQIPLSHHEATVWADPARTRQILRILIANAIRYGGPEVEIRTLSQGPDTLIEVIDNGPEIPATEQERIFRADLRNGSPVTRPTSVGLGLTVARQLARQMGGDLVYRRTPDGSSVFEVRLPSEPLESSYQISTSSAVIPT